MFLCNHDRRICNPPSRSNKVYSFPTLSQGITRLIQLSKRHLKLVVTNYCVILGLWSLELMSIQLNSDHIQSHRKICSAIIWSLFKDSVHNNNQFSHLMSHLCSLSHTCSLYNNRLTTISVWIPRFSANLRSILCNNIPCVHFNFIFREIISCKAISI